MPELLAAGVSALKIEGRLKEPEYVALTTRCYRLALVAALEGMPFVLEPERVLKSWKSLFRVDFRRVGSTDRVLMHLGKNTAKRGVPIGAVAAVSGNRVLVRLTRSVRRGQGVVFEELHDQDAERRGAGFQIL